MSKGRRVPPQAIPDMRITDRVCEADRLYFRQHPTAAEYERPYVAGEAFTPAVAVLVTNIRPGVRGRIFIDADGLSDQMVVDTDKQKRGR